MMRIQTIISLVSKAKLQTDVANAVVVTNELDYTAQTSMKNHWLPYLCTLKK